MSIVKVTRKYQITIPKEIRERLRIRIGDELLIRTDGSRIIIEPIIKRAKNPLEEMLSLVKKPLKVDAVKLVEESWEEGVH